MQPPKKNKAAIAAAAELKKKNTKEAEEIISMLQEIPVDVAYPLKDTGEASSAINKFRSFDSSDINISSSIDLTATGSTDVVMNMKPTETVSSFLE